MALDLSLQKLPPQNIEAEQMVLGAVIIENDAVNRIIDLLVPDDFYKAAHKRIFEVILRMIENREEVDLVTLSDALRGPGSLESVGGASYLALLVSLVPTSANIKSHARIVREKSILRRVIHAASDIIRRGYDDEKPIAADELLDHAGQAIFEISQKKAGNALVSMRVAVPRGFDIIEKRYEQKGRITGVPTGFFDLDEKLAGLQPSDLIIIAGRPSMGKTAFALNIAAHAAIEKGKKVAVFSLEMSQDQLMLRLMGSEARVDAHRMRVGDLQERDWIALSRAAGSLAEAGIFIDDTSAISAMELRAKARRMKAEHGLDLIIVDYLQLMRGSGDEKNREQEISGLSRSLKALAKDLCVPVIALSQLNRALESRGGNSRRPMLSDLRESGAIEQDSDVILFLYREEVYSKCACPGDRECLCGRRGSAEVIIGKQRNGPTGMIDLAFIDRFTRFENAVRGQA